LVRTAETSTTGQRRLVGDCPAFADKERVAPDDRGTSPTKGVPESR